MQVRWSLRCRLDQNSTIRAAVSRSISTTLSRKIWREPAAFYLNIHSRRFPGAAIRSQL
jgi:hypothetical protein